MSETPATPTSTPTTPIKEDEVKKAATTLNGSNAKKFDGDGQPFKGKLIGMEDLSIDRDEKVCLDSMFKLKAVVRARGEHKQRIQINLTMSAVKIYDDITKAQIASHEIERISFVVIDPRDTRAFGYIYNTSDDRHQFWAIKTERTAAATVLALKELFEMAFEQFTNAEKTNEETNKVTTPSSSSPLPSPPPTVPTQERSPAAPVPSLSPPPPPPPVSQPVVPNPTPSLLDDNIWGESSASTVPTVQKTTEPVASLWDMNEPVVPVVQPQSRAVDPLEDLFGDLALSTPTQPLASTVNNNSLFDVFPSNTSTPPPPTSANPYGNFYGQAAQPNLLNTNPTLLPQQPQRPSTPATMPFLQQQQQPQRPSTPTTMPLLQQQQQQNSLSPTAMSPVAPPSVTSPFAGLDLLGGLSSGATAKPTKELFYPSGPPAKTMQQLLMEKQRNPFSRS